MKLAHLINESSSVRILLVVLAMLFTLCVGPAHSAPEPGTITLVVQDEPESVDPQMTTTSAVGKVLLQNVVETLTLIDTNDGTITPRLATSWKKVDAKTWQFSLRKGVKFHDGEDFNAEAVLFNIKRLYYKGRKCHIRDKFFGYLKMEPKALDSHTVEIKTDIPIPILPTLLGTLTMCSPNTPLKKLTRQPIGTGPYNFIKYAPGMQIVLERFDGYWGKQPQVKKVTYVWRTESAVRAAMVAIGEADLAPNIAVQDATRPDLDYSFYNSETTFQRIGAWEPPLNDRRVRMALNLAVDREALRGSIYSKDVVPATQIVCPTISGHNPGLKVWPYDPKKAKKLIDEARRDGVPVDKQITLMGRNNIHPAASEELEALASFFRAIGLKVKVKMMEVGVYIPYRDKPYPKDAGPFLLQNMHDNNKGDPVFTVFAKYHCDGKSGGLCDKKLDEMIEKATVTSGEERKKLWQAIFKRIHEDNISDVALFHMVGYTRVGKRINYKPSIETNSQVHIQKITFK